MREFSTGATRDDSTDKVEPWGFNSALADKRFAEYMQSHQVQADGKTRASDNWKKGMPTEVYKHSLSRHTEDLRLILEGHPEEATEQDIEVVLCAIRFNVNGMLLERIKLRQPVRDDGTCAADPAFGKHAIATRAELEAAAAEKLSHQVADNAKRHKK